MTSFDVTNSDSVEELIMTGNTSPIMNDLQLYTLYSLKKLAANQTTSLQCIRFPKYANAEEANKGASGRLWNNLEYLDVSNSSISKIQYGSADTNNNYLDMTQLTNLTTLKCNYCVSITSIENLNYTTNAGLSGFFRNNTIMNRISGRISNTGSSISYIFAECKALNNINDLTFDFRGVTNANGALDRCHKATTAMVKKILDACGSSLLSISSICHMADGTSTIGTSADRADRTIPSNLFEKTNPVKPSSSYVQNPSSFCLSYSFKSASYTVSIIGICLIPASVFGFDIANPATPFRV
jgi:hypothetical protein